MTKCPKCNGELSKKSVGSIDLDECQSCKGIWFDKDELREVKDATDSDLNWMDFEIWKHEKAFSYQASDLKCPKCQKPMVSLEYGDTAVVIDHCPSCRGTWLDKGEFKKIVDSLQRELLTKSFSGYVREAIQEGFEVAVGSESFLSEWKDFATVLRLMQYRLFVENPALKSAMLSLQKSVQ